MPRPKKCRKVCQMPMVRVFRPVRDNSLQSAVVLSVDEYESIRLIDKQRFSQEECGRYMQIARTTVQIIYDSARKKLAEALVNGLTLSIEGGDFRLCDGNEEYCGCGGCRRHQCGQIMMNPKRDNKVRIAIPLDENKQDICIVLARAPYFLFKDEDIETIVENPVAEVHGGAGVQVAQFLVNNGVNVLIAVHCGQNAADIFTAVGVKIYKSANKVAIDNLGAFTEGKLDELTQFYS